MHKNGIPIKWNAAIVNTSVLFILRQVNVLRVRKVCYFWFAAPVTKLLPLGPQTILPNGLRVLKADCIKKLLSLC